MSNLEKIQSLIDSSEYEQAANLFLELTKTRLSIEYHSFDRMKWDAKDAKCRNIFKFTLERDGETYSDLFGASYNDTYTGATVKEFQETKDYNKRIQPPPIPTNYDILACLSIDYFQDVDDVAGVFGEMKPSQAIAIFKQDAKLRAFFTDEEEQQMLNAIN